MPQVCPSCSGENVMLGKMFVLQGARIGTRGGDITAAAIPYIRVAKPNPGWNFIVVGALATAFAIFLQSLGGWGWWSAILVLGLFLMAWPFLPWHRRQVEAWEDQIQWLERHWICVSCGDSWEK